LISANSSFFNSPNLESLDIASIVLEIISLAKFVFNSFIVPAEPLIFQFLKIVTKQDFDSHLSKSLVNSKSVIFGIVCLSK
jgi:hypothetical protein